MQTITPLRALAASLALACAGQAAAAVHVSANGQGQVLLFPYYTVNAQNQTLLHLANSTDEVKAVKVRFREALNGRIALDFNLYLAPHADWRAALASTGEDTPPLLVTLDRDCTVPTIEAQGQPFLNNFYVGSQDDDGPNTLDRTREGLIEVIEMGVVVDDGDVEGPRLPLPDASGNRNGVDNRLEGSGRTFARDASLAGGVPRNCQNLYNAWQGGVWDRDPSVDMDEPSGGLSGSVVIVNVGEGYAFSQRAETLDDFHTVADATELHTDPGSTLPSLASARTRAAGPVESFADGTLLRWAPGTPNAVSSVLMHRQALNDFATASETLAASEWIIGFPTRDLHIEHDSALPSARRPFTDNTDDRIETPGVPPGNIHDHSVFDAEGSCEAMTMIHRDQDGHPIEEFPCGFPVCPTEPPPPRLRWQSNVIAWNQDAVETGEPSAVFGARRALNFDVRDREGRPQVRGPLAITLGDEDNYMIADPGAPAGTVRDRLSGLPAIGFWAARFVNANAQPGLLASFAVLTPHVWNQARDRVTVGEGESPIVTPVPDP